MNNLKRDKKVLYLSKKEKDGRLYEPPIRKNLNYQPTNSTGDVLAYGEEYTKYLTITTNIEEAKNFSNFDRCYVYVLPPETHDKLCDTADYYVYGDPIITSNEGIIKLKKLSGELNEKDN